MTNDRTPAPVPPKVTSRRHVSIHFPPMTTMSRRSCSADSGAVRPRVVHLISATIGGAELQLLALLRESARTVAPSFDHQVLLINDGSLVAEFRSLCRTTVIVKRGKVDLHFLLDLGRELRRVRPAVLHTWTETPNLWGPSVAAVAVPRTAVVVAVVALEEWKGALLRAADRVVFRLADRVVGCAQAVTARAVARGAPARRCATVPLGVSTTLNPPPLPGTQTVVLLGRFDYRKGHALLLRALPTVLATCPAARFIMSGPTFDEHEERLRADIGGQAAVLGVSGTLTITGPRRPDDAIGEADLVVVPSSSEGLPNVILEAFAMGRPVVATAVGGIPEVVHDGETGWLVPPGEPDALAQALIEALLHPAEAARRGRAGQEVVAQRSFSSVLEQWYDQYRLVLRGPVAAGKGAGRARRSAGEQTGATE
jgi:glycosyltransferase involved in cell wall biosynthesis